MVDNIRIKELPPEQWFMVLALLRQLQFQRVKSNPLKWSMSLHDPRMPDGFMAVGAWYNDALVGVTYGSQHNEYVKLIDSYVTDGYRHNGVGQSLFQSFVSVAKERNCIALVMGENTDDSRSGAYFAENGCVRQDGLWVLRL